jgi:hypothetical protein
MSPASGLGRFVGAPAAAARAEAVAGHRCELCADEMRPQHAHVVDVVNRRLMCTCRPCGLLFERSQAGNGRFRAVPDRVLSDRGPRPDPADWDALQIPVGVAFFLRQGATGQVTAFYPSPAGATECLLDLTAWQRLSSVCPLIEQAEPDVEAVLARRGRDDVECFVVPIDVCYELVGRLRLLWKGFDGGQEARAALAEFFATLRQRSLPYCPTPRPTTAPIGGGDHG